MIKTIAFIALLTLAIGCGPETQCQADCDETNEICAEQTDCERCDKQDTADTCAECFECLRMRYSCPGKSVDYKCADACDLCR